MLHVRQMAVIGCFMSQEKSDWYSGDTTLFYSGSLWWPLCRQWQHLRQHHRNTCAYMHTVIRTHKHRLHMHTCKKTCQNMQSILTVPMQAHTIPCSKPLSLSFSHSHTALCHCPRPVVYSLEHYILCWRLQCVCDCWRLMPFCLHSAGVHAWMGGPGRERTVHELKKWDRVHYVWLLTWPNTLA